MAFETADMAMGILLKELRKADKYSGFTVLDCTDSGKQVLVIVSENERINGRLLEIIKRAIGEESL